MVLLALESLGKFGCELKQEAALPGCQGKFRDNISHLPANLQPSHDVRHPTLTINTNSPEMIVKSDMATRAKSAMGQKQAFAMHKRMSALGKSGHDDRSTTFGKLPLNTSSPQDGRWRTAKRFPHDLWFIGEGKHAL